MQLYITRFIASFFNFDSFVSPTEEGGYLYLDHLNAQETTMEADFDYVNIYLGI